MAEEPYDSAKQFEDLLEVQSRSSDEPNLTWEELFAILGVEKDAEGNVKGVDAVNACLQVQSNPNVQALPHKERIRVIRSAADAISALMSGDMK